MKKTICFLTAHLPSPLSKQAGQKIAYNHLVWLNESFDVILIAFANKDELAEYDEKLYSSCTQIHIFPITNLSRIALALQNILLPLVVALRYKSKVKKLVEKVGTEDMVFWLEYTQMCQYIPENKYNQKWIVVCHDVLVQMFERKEKANSILKLMYLAEKARISRWEKKFLNRCDSVVTLSIKDKNIISDRYNIKNSSVLYPMVGNLSVNKNRFCLGRERAIIFFGAMNRHENEDAVLWFVKNIFSDLLTVFPDTKFMVVGTKPSEKIRKLADINKNIIVTGFIDDPTIYFEQAWFSIAPLQLGAGVKIKVLECLAYGISVVASTVGAEGIEAEETDGLIVADDMEIYRERCLQLLEDEARCVELGRRAHVWYRDTYTFMQESPEKLNRIIQTANR